MDKDTSLIDITKDNDDIIILSSPDTQCGSSIGSVKNFIHLKNRKFQRRSPFVRPIYATGSEWKDF